MPTPRIALNVVLWPMVALLSVMAGIVAWAMFAAGLP